MKNLKYIIIIILVTILIIATAYIAHEWINKKNEKAKLYIYQDLTDHSLVVTQYKLTKQEIEDSNIKEMNVYKAKSNNVEYYSYEGKYITLKDNNEYYLYDCEKGIATQLFLGEEKIDNVQIVANDKEAFGVFASMDNKDATVQYYCLTNNQYFDTFDYWNPEYVGDEVYLSYDRPDKENKINTEIGLFNAKTTETIIKISLNNKEYDEAYVFTPLTDKNYDIKYWVLTTVSGEPKRVYNNQKKLILDNIEGLEFGEYGAGNGNIALCSKDKEYFNIYNSNGKLIKKSAKYQKVYRLLNNYAVVVDNNNLKLIDFDGNVIKEIIKWDDNRYSFSTSYMEYDEQSGKPNKIYIIINDGQLEPSEKGYEIEFSYAIK